MAETDANGATQRWFVYGNYIDEPLMMVAKCLDSTDPTNKFAHTLYYVQDALYSTRALVASKSWVIEEQTAYDVYGNPLTWTSGDADADRNINSDDLSLFVASFGKSKCDPNYNWRCDFNYDGTVNADDLNVLRGRYSSTPANQQSFFTNPYYFTGRRVDLLDDGNLQLQHNRNRYYDYYTGRWTTHDPLEYVDGMNSYEYGLSKPITFADPFGYGEYQTVSTITEPPNSYAGNIAFSTSVYGIWPTNWTNLWERTSIKARTWATITGGNVKGKVHAAKHLKHFALNSGKPLDIGYADLIKDCSKSKGHFIDELNDAVSYVDVKKPFGMSIVTKADYEAKTSHTDWFWAVKDYRTWAEATDIQCVEGGKIKMKWTIHFRDVYDFDLHSSAPAGWVVDGEMAKMHRWADMREYVMTGSYKVSVEWKCGDPNSLTYTPE